MTMLKEGTQLIPTLQTLPDLASNTRPKPARRHLIIEAARMPLIAKQQQQPAKRPAPASSRARRTEDRPKRLGRPPKFNPEIANEVCDLIACGLSLRKASAALGIPHETVLRWAVRYPD